VLILDAEQVRALLDRVSTIDALASMFRGAYEAPERHHHGMEVPGAPEATLLLMPAWIPGKYLGVKVASVFPGNGALGRPAVQAVYLLFSGETGEHLATVDGGELTARRTAAASALAARHLARRDASRLLVVGTGRLAVHLAQSHAAVRPIRQVAIWGRDAAKANAVARQLRSAGLQASAATDLAAAVADSDVVSCATLSQEPLIRGAWLQPGTHLDLVGGFTPKMREADDEALRRASVFIDTPGAMKEAGDIVVPLATGVLKESEIRGDLRDLTRAAHRGRSSDDEITMFKSVGASEEDLAAAALAYERASVSASSGAIAVSR
jgi:alanine dehydrogenase